MIIRYIINISIAAAVLLLSAASAYAEAEKVIKEVPGSVVAVVALDENGRMIAHGSGFAAGSSAVITNYHIISNAREIKIQVSGEVRDVEGIIYLDREGDVAIIRISGNGLIPFRLGDLSGVKAGDKIYVAGNPGGYAATVTDGMISGFRETAQGRRLFQINVPISPDASGGPVLNQANEVIGIAACLVEGAQTLGIGLPASFIQEKTYTGSVMAAKGSESMDYRKTAGYWFYLGTVYGYSGMHKEAIAAYRQAVRIMPDHGDAYYALGVSYGTLLLFRDSADALREAIRINPGYTDAYFFLGCSYLALNEIGMASDQVKILNGLDPVRAESLSLLILEKVKEK